MRSAIFVKAKIKYINTHQMPITALFHIALNPKEDVRVCKAAADIIVTNAPANLWSCLLHRTYGASAAVRADVLRKAPTQDDEFFYMFAADPNEDDRVRAAAVSRIASVQLKSALANDASASVREAVLRSIGHQRLPKKGERK